MPKKIPGVTSARTRLTDGGRHPEDWYITPPIVTQLLLDHEKFDGTIWECACGTGEMSEVLLSNGYHVISTDLVDRGYGEGNLDFLQFPVQDADPNENIVTNPPFALAEEFAIQAINMRPKKLALLQRISWLEARGRHDRLWATCPPSRVLILSNRHTLWRGDIPAEERVDKGGVMGLAWYVWDDPHAILARRRKKPPEIHWLLG